MRAPSMNRNQRLRWRPLLTVVLPATFLPITLFAQATSRERTWGETEPSKEVPIILTVSGGISLGSYQAGLNWGLIRFFKYLQSDSIYRARNRMPKYRLLSAVGASAGNINSLVSALEWCSATINTPPEKSLFWRTWVDVGLSELLPAERTDHGGLFSRDYFEQSIRPAIKSWSETEVLEPCDLPIGVTITRLRPTSFQVNEHITAQTQRYAAIVRVKTEAGSDSVPHLLYEEPDSAFRSRSLGAIIALEPTSADGQISPEAVFDLAEASSAFPLAFSPKTLKYYDAADLAGGWQHGSCVKSIQTGRCAVPRSASFLDGGVFDNNPLSLALAIHRQLRQIGHSVGDSVPIVIYIDPDALRGRLSAVRVHGDSASLPDNVDRAGLPAVLQFLAGAIPAARQYELQTLARSLADEDPAAPLEHITSTDRGFPVNGEYLASFAAFLGKPLREFDFYVGIYDAVDFIAAHVLCDAVRLHNESAQSCSARRKRELLQDQKLSLGSIAPLLLTRIAFLADSVEEQGPASAVQQNAQMALSTIDEESLTVLRAIAEANAAQLQKMASCSGTDLIGELLCQGHFANLIDSIASTEGVQGIVARWATDSACVLPYADSHRSHCRADQSFMRLLKDKHGYTSDLVSNLLHELRSTADTQAFAGLVVTSTEFVYRNLELRYRKGWDTDPSTIPPYDWLHYWWASFLPYYIALPVGVTGFEAGWRPAYHWSPSVAFIIPASIAQLHLHAAEQVRYPTTCRVGFGLLNKTRRFIVSELQASLDVHEQCGRPHLPDWAFMDGAFAVGLLGGKVRLAATSVPSHFRYGYGKTPIYMTLGLADFNGLLYWASRMRL